MRYKGRRNNQWSALFFVMMIVGGFCVIGFWQTYQIKCDYGKQWVFAKLPPQYECIAH